MTKVFCDICGKECTENSIMLEISEYKDASVRLRYSVRNLCKTCGERLISSVKKEEAT